RIRWVSMLIPSEAVVRKRHWGIPAGRRRSRAFAEVRPRGLYNERNKRATLEFPMQIPVLIEPVPGNGYRARGGEPLVVEVEAPTRDQALAKLKEILQSRLQNGAEVVTLDLSPPPHPLAEFVGMFKDDPLIEDWKKSVAKYRRKVDKNSERP